MILGIGADIVDVADMERRLARGSLLKAFSAAERAYADGCGQRRAEVLAARWAAREAFGKALGTGLPHGWPLDQLEVDRDEAGAPRFRFGADMAGRVPAGARVFLTLTHTPAWAAAFVVIETD